MEKEKYYLVKSEEVFHIERDEDNDNEIEGLHFNFCNKFENEDELLIHLIGSRMSDDGQMARSIEEILKIIVSESSYIIENLSEYEVEHKFKSKKDLLLYMRNCLQGI
jgi:hypothetical protein